MIVSRCVSAEHKIVEGGKVPLSEGAKQALCFYGDKICRQLTSSSEKCEGVTLSWLNSVSLATAGSVAGASLGALAGEVYGDTAMQRGLEGIWSYLFPVNEETWSDLIYSRMTNLVGFYVQASVTPKISPWFKVICTMGGGVALPAFVSMIMAVYNRVMEVKNQPTLEQLGGFLEKIHYDSIHDCYRINGRNLTARDTKNISKMACKYNLICEILLSNSSQVRELVLKKIDLKWYSSKAQKHILRGVEELEGLALNQEKVFRAVDLICKFDRRGNLIKLTYFHMSAQFRLNEALDMIENLFDSFPIRQDGIESYFELRHDLSLALSSVAKALEDAKLVGVDQLKTRSMALEVKMLNFLQWATRNHPSESDDGQTRQEMALSICADFNASLEALKQLYTS